MRISSREKHLSYIGICVALLPVLLTRDFTPMNELRYLSIADEALRNHTLFAFTNHGTPYADKPPLYLWFVMLCRWITGEHRMWLLALFSLVPALGITHIMDRWSEQDMDNESRTLARLMLMTSGLFLISAVTLRMDMLMCLFIVLSLRAFWQIRMNENSCSRWLFPVYMFLAVFTKGPLGILIPLCCTTVFLCMSGCIRQFFRYWGWRTWLILAVCFSIWFGAIYAEGGTSYLYDLLVHQTIGRAVNSFHHNEPFYYYAVSIWYSIAPWSLLAVCVLAAALRPKFIRSDLQRFFLTTGITTFLLLSCISAKLQIYLLPAIPFFIYATAMFLTRFNDTIWMKAAIAVPSVLFAVALPTLVVISSNDRVPYLNEGMIYAAATILTLNGTHSLYLLFNKKHGTNLDGIILRMGAGMLAAVLVGGCSLHKLNAYIGYGALCEKAVEISQEEGIRDVRTWKISRAENMDVYLHRPIKVVQEDVFPNANEGRPFLLLTRSSELKRFPRHDSQTIGRFAIIVIDKTHD